MNDTHVAVMTYRPYFVVTILLVISRDLVTTLKRVIMLCLLLCPGKEIQR